MSDLVRQLEKAFEWSGDAMLREAADEITILRARLARVKDEADYDRRQAEHLRTVVDRLNAEVARLTAQLATARRDALEEAAKKFEAEDHHWGPAISKALRALIDKEPSA